MMVIEQGFLNLHDYLACCLKILRCVAQLFESYFGFMKHNLYYCSHSEHLHEHLPHWFTPFKASIPGIGNQNLCNVSLLEWVYQYFNKEFTITQLAISVRFSSGHGNKLMPLLWKANHINVYAHIHVSIQMAMCWRHATTQEK